jgi:hypothetical protein
MPHTVPGACPNFSACTSRVVCGLRNGHDDDRRGATRARVARPLRVDLHGKDAVPYDGTAS